MSDPTQKIIDLLSEAKEELGECPTPDGLVGIRFKAVQAIGRAQDLVCVLQTNAKNRTEG